MDKVCFTGHSVFPSVQDTMERPQDFPAVLNVAFAIVATLCSFLGLAGYYMYGSGVLDVVTFNLHAGKLKTLCAAMILVNPIAKFAITQVILVYSVSVCCDAVLKAGLAGHSIGVSQGADASFRAQPVIHIFVCASMWCTVLCLMRQLVTLWWSCRNQLHWLCVRPLLPVFQ